MCFCFVDRMSVSFCCFEIVIVIITVGSISMDRFVKKSAVKSLKRQNSDKEYDKEYDGNRSKCCVLCKFGFIKIIPLKHSANQMSYVFIYYH